MNYSNVYNEALQDVSKKLENKIKALPPIGQRTAEQQLKADHFKEVISICDGMREEVDEKQSSEKKPYTVNSEGKWDEKQPVDYKSFVDYWNYVNDNDGRSNVRVTNKKRKQIRARLRTWRAEEIKKALRNRAKSAFMNGDGAKYKNNWKSFWRNDEKVEHWLNHTPQSEQSDTKTDDPYGTTKKDKRNNGERGVDEADEGAGDDSGLIFGGEN